MVWVFLTPMAIAGSVGFYAGTFDPPTRSQIRMIRCALGDDGLHEECGELGKSISRLVVSVIEDGEKDTFASTREQMLMLKRALKKYGDRVEIVASTAERAEREKRALLDDRNVERLFQLVPGDADKGLNNFADGPDPRFVAVVFPLVEEGGFLKAGAELHRIGDPGVMEVVEKLGLYEEVGDDLAGLQRSLF